MNDLRDQIAEALEGRMSRLLREAGIANQLADAVMPIVDEAITTAVLTGRTQSADQIVEYQRRLREIDSDLLHAERENRRLVAELARLKAAT